MEGVGGRSLGREGRDNGSNMRGAQNIHLSVHMVTVSVIEMQSPEGGEAGLDERCLVCVEDKMPAAHP